MRLRQSMCIYLENHPGECHPDPIWNDGALGFFGGASLQQEQEEHDK